MAAFTRLVYLKLCMVMHCGIAEMDYPSAVLSLSLAIVNGPPSVIGKSIFREPMMQHRQTRE